MNYSYFISDAEIQRIFVYGMNSLGELSTDRKSRETFSISLDKSHLYGQMLLNHTLIIIVVVSAYLIALLWI